MIRIWALALALLSASASAQMSYGPPPPGDPYAFSPTQPDPNGPTAVCIKAKSPPPTYNCYRDNAVDALVRAQSPEYLRREADKMKPAQPVQKPYQSTKPRTDI